MIQDSEKLALLRQVELLQGIDTADVELIAQQMTDEFYTDGDVVVREGDPGDRMFLLLTGTMHVYVERDDKVITYARLRAGQCFGEMALIESAPRSATVQAEASSHCLTLSRQGFLDLLNDHPNISPGIMKDLSGRLRGMNVQVQDYARRQADADGSSPKVLNFDDYDTGDFHDEMLEADGRPRAGGALLARRVSSLPEGELLRRQRAAEQAMLQLGITFNVYGDESGTEKIFPFDILPRIVEAADWEYIERGLKQRIQALNLFIDDVYNRQSIVKDGIVPEHMVRSAQNLQEPCMGAQSLTRHLVSYHRDRSGTRPRRANVCPRRQSTVSFRCLLRAGKPPGAEGHLPPGLRGIPGASDR